MGDGESFLSVAKVCGDASMAPVGLEPTRPFGPGILSAVRLPIPPRGQPLL